MKKLDQNTRSLIEQYLLNKLNKAERNAFHERLTSDDAFAELFKFESDIRQCLFYMENQTTRAYLDKLYQERKDKGLLLLEIENTEENTKESSENSTQQHKKENVRLLNRVLRSVAAVLLIGGLIALYFFLSPKQSTDQLFAANYNTPQWSETVRGIENSATIKTAYETGQFKEAMQLMEPTLDDPAMQLYTGICQLELNQTEAAIKTFSQLKTNETFNDQATWYLAMCYLKSKNEASCKSELRMLAKGSIETSDNMKQKATKLLEEL